MRISDWSSDVCSSDLLSSRLPCQCPFLNESASISNKSTVQASFLCKSQLSSLLSPSGSTVDMTVGCFSLANPISTKCTPGPLDRKSVVEGKSVAVRVDLGGRRIINKKKLNATSQAQQPHKIKSIRIIRNDAQ